MKKILLLALTFLTIAFTAKAQTIDSTTLQLPIKLTIKVKYWAIVSSYLVNKSNFSDTVSKCMGSGTQLDSLSSGQVRAGRFYECFKRWIADPVGANYAYITDILTANGPAGGIIAQLNTIIANGQPTAKTIAAWFKGQLLALLQTHTDASDRQIANGIANPATLVKNPSDN